MALFQWSYKYILLFPVVSFRNDLVVKGVGVSPSFSSFFIDNFSGTTLLQLCTQEWNPEVKSSIFLFLLFHLW